MSDQASENSKEWYMRRIKEEIEAGRTENALSYASIAITEAEKRDYGFDPCTCGIIELAIRNPNVASYIEHWEGRAK